MPIRENSTCLICGSLRDFVGKPSRVPETCGAYACRGALYRRRSEAKYNLFAFDEWTPDMAYALGLFYADGCLQKTSSGGSWRLVFVNTDKATVSWWHAFVGNPHPLVEVRPETVPGATLTKWMSCTVSDTLGERMCALGVVPRKSALPIRMPNVPEEVRPDFIRGFLDGDGSLGLRKSPSKGGKRLVATFTCNSQPFLHDLKQVLALAGVRASTNRISLHISGSNAERLCALVYDRPGQRMQRKALAWQEWKRLRATCGGLISESDPYVTLRGVREAEWHTLLGSMPDKQLAGMIGKSKSNVAFFRKKLAIQPWREAS